MAMSPLWASGAWASGAWNEDAWGIAPPGTGVVWAEDSWSGGSWANGTWLDVPKIYANRGAYSVNGQSVDLLADFITPVEYGSYTLTGYDATLSATIAIAADQGTYTLSGQEVVLSGNLYRIYSVNGDNEVETNEVGISIVGEGLSSTNVVELQYGRSPAWWPGSWASGAWEDDVWNDISGGLITESLTNISASSNLVTADMPDIVSTSIPFTDANHTYHRIYISDGVSEDSVVVDVLPPIGYVVLPVQPADAFTSPGQSIFSGLTINPNSQVLLPVVMGGGSVVWETQNGNATGRLTLSSILDEPVPVSIPFWDDDVGWDTIETTIADESYFNRNIEIERGTYSLSGQDVTLAKSTIVSVESGAYTLTGVDTGLYKGVGIDVDSLFVNTSITNTLVAEGMVITSVWGVGSDTIQSGSRFVINGLGFGTDPSITSVVLANSSGSFTCSVVSIVNDRIVAIVPPEALALTQPVTLYVGDFLRDVNGEVILDSVNSPLYTTDSIGFDFHPNVTVIQFRTNNLSVGSSLGSSLVVQHNVLSPEDLNVDITLSPSSTNVGNIYPVDITIGTILTQPILTQHHTLVTNNLDVGVSIDESELEQNITINVNDSRVEISLSQATLTQHNVLSVNNLNINTSVVSPIMTQHNLLSVNGLTVGSSLTSTDLVQIRRIDTDDINISVSIDSAVINQHSSISVDDISVTVSLEDSSVTRTYSLSTDDLSVSVSEGTPSLTQSSSLNTNNIFVATNTTTPTLTQHNLLSVDNLSVSSSITSTRMGSELEAVKVDRVLVFSAADSEIYINP